MRRQKTIFLIFEGIVLYVFLYYHISIPCFFKFLFSIPCPGCGMTRAFYELFIFHFITAFSFNFFSFSLFLYFFFFFFFFFSLFIFFFFKFFNSFSIFSISFIFFFFFFFFLSYIFN